MVKFIDGCISSSDSTRREEVSRILFKLLGLKRECIALITRERERERECIALYLSWQIFLKQSIYFYLYVLLSWVGPEQFLEESRAELTDTK